MPLFNAEERLAIPILLREVGVIKSILLGARTRKRQDAGEPFQMLGPPSDDNDKLSRDQVGPAILLYQELAKLVSRDEAYRITEKIVVTGAIPFMQERIGPIRRAELESMDQQARDEFIQIRGTRFFNATVRWDEVSARAVNFTVLSCTFPPLCAAAGVPELAPIFCKGDEKFFGSVEPDVRLERPQTIAEGAPNCPFYLRWVDDTDN